MRLRDATGRLVFFRIGGVLIFEETENSRTQEFAEIVLRWSSDLGHSSDGL